MWFIFNNLVKVWYIIFLGGQLVKSSYFVHQRAPKQYESQTGNQYIS